MSRFAEAYYRAKQANQGRAGKSPEQIDAEVKYNSAKTKQALAQAKKYEAETGKMKTAETKASLVRFVAEFQRGGKSNPAALETLRNGQFNKHDGFVDFKGENDAIHFIDRFGNQAFVQTVTKRYRDPETGENVEMTSPLKGL